MKVNELMKLLQQFNPDAEITTPCSETIELSYISEGTNKQTTPIVFIEPADKVKEIESSEVTWYEDGSMIEWWENDIVKPKHRRINYKTLKETIEIARSNKMLLTIQPATQDESIMIDYTEEPL